MKNRYCVWCKIEKDRETIPSQDKTYALYILFTTKELLLLKFKFPHIRVNKDWHQIYTSILQIAKFIETIQVIY